MKCLAREERDRVDVTFESRKRQVVKRVLATSDRQDRAERPQGGAEAQIPQQAEVTTLMIDDVAVVAGKQLVAAVAGENDLHMLSRQARDQIGWDGRGVGERLVEARQQLLENLEVIRLDEQRVVLGAVGLGNLPRVGQLVVPVLQEPHGEGLDW